MCEEHMPAEIQSCLHVPTAAGSIAPKRVVDVVAVLQRLEESCGKDAATRIDPRQVPWPAIQIVVLHQVYCIIADASALVILCEVWLLEVRAKVFAGTRWPDDLELLGWTDRVEIDQGAGTAGPVCDVRGGLLVASFDDTCQNSGREEVWDSKDKAWE